MNFIPEIERLLSGERNKFSELFGLVDGLMLTGSYATKSSTRNSDIDIIVLSRNVNYLYTESRTEFVLVEVQLVGSKRNASADFTLESTNLTLCNRELAGLSITLQET